MFLCLKILTPRKEHPRVPQTVRKDHLSACYRNWTSIPRLEGSITQRETNPMPKTMPEDFEIVNCEVSNRTLQTENVNLEDNTCPQHCFLNLYDTCNVNNFRGLYNDRGVGVIFWRDTTSWWNVMTQVPAGQFAICASPTIHLVCPPKLCITFVLCIYQS